MNIPPKESITVEFKSERSHAVDDSVIIDNVVAFANTRGGTLYLGVEDDGTPSGVDCHHRDVTQLAAFLFNNTVPPVQVRADSVDVDGVRVVAIAVDESTELTCTRSGRVLRRVLKADGEPEVITMYPYEFVSRLSSIGQYDYSDQPAPNSSLSDLDSQSRDLLRRSIARTHADDQILSLADADFDGALGLTTHRVPSGEVVPTIAGILMIGTKQALRRCLPTASATFQVLRGGSPVVDETLRLPLVVMFRRVEELLVPWNPNTEVMLGSQHANFGDFDGNAFREAMVNAFCHRDYTIMAPVRFHLDEYGLTIANPGGFMRGVDLGNLLTVSPTPRNRRLADILKRCGYVERTGRGVDRIIARTVAAGRPIPSYSQSTADEVVLFLRKSAVDERFVRMIDVATVKRGNRLSDAELIVLAAINQFGKLGVADVARKTSMDRERASEALSSLVAVDVVKLHKRNTYDIVWPASAKTHAGVNAGGLNASDDRLLGLIRDMGGIVTVSAVAERLGVSYSTAYKRLKALQITGLVQHRGKTRNSQYYLS